MPGELSAKVPFRAWLLASIWKYLASANRFSSLMKSPEGWNWWRSCSSPPKRSTGVRSMSSRSLKPSPPIDSFCSRPAPSYRIWPRSNGTSLPSGVNVRAKALLAPIGVTMTGVKKSFCVLV